MGRDKAHRATWKYHPEDFGEPPIRVLHMDLEFSVHDDHTRARSVLHAMTGDTPLSVLDLNAKDLEILEAASPGQETDFQYDQARSILSIRFRRPVPPYTQFSVATLTICRPSAHILEGLYYDETPPGAPPTQITQCQQWGFQRLVPCIDEMTAKCTYRTTIIADARYTHLLSNGDVSVPRHAVGEGRDSITYENMVTPMAPYLFFLGAGTYAGYRRRFEYPRGKPFDIELLVPPESKIAPAEEALSILADAILWVHLFTGKDQYRDQKIRSRLYALGRRLYRCTSGEGERTRCATLRKKQAALVSAIAPGYTYTGTVYREIGMQNSDFGGMENVGNTTISTNRIMPFDQMTDAAFEYMALVKVHEFYHNLNGSEVTGKSPFEIWLNEAVTVHIERQFHAFHFGEAYSRLQTVLTLLSPDGGTLMHDRGAGSMPIEPDGFNDPNELITSVTYVKAPEFVRMIETLMGRERFCAGLSRYHSTYRHSNASRRDWIACMEQESGHDFSTMAGQWLKQTGYPDIEVVGAYSPARKSYTVRIRQHAESGQMLWQFPFVVALVDAEGRDIAEKCVWVVDREAEAVFEGVARPAYLSLNRGYSAYGKVHHDPPDQELLLQVHTDRDTINRYLAFYRLIDREKLRLLRDPAAEVSEEITDLIVSLLEDSGLMERAGGQFLTIFESVEDPAFAHRYGALYKVRQRILAATADRHEDRLLSIYRRYSGFEPGEGLAGRIRAIKKRQVKNAALGILAASDTPEVHDLLRNQYREAENAQDRIVAFTHILRSSAPERRTILDQFEAESRAHPVAWETFLSAAAQNSSSDTVAILRRIESSPAFRIEQANDQRALFVRFAQNKKISLETEEGREYFGEVLARLAQVNEYSTVNALSVLGYIDKMEAQHQVPLVALLTRLVRSLDAARTPSVYNTARRLLAGAPRAVERYEEEKGESLSDILPS